jgi:N-acetylglutamate synthase-like GNAT family acetyltransferase
MTDLRPARRSDAAVLTELAMRSKAHWGYDDEFLERCRPALTITPAEVERWRIVVAERDGSIVGFCAISLGDELPEIEQLFAEPDAIGSGVGRALLRDALDAAWAGGVESVAVESDPGAEAFYRSQGAVRIGERRSDATGRMLPLLRFVASEP